MREFNHKEGWMLKNWCFQIVVLDKTHKSPLDWMEIKPVNPKGNQPWVFFGRTDAEAPELWPPDAELTPWKRPWCWERLRARREEGKGTTEDEMAGCHHWLNGHEFEQIPGGSGQGILVCCSPWDDGKSWTQLSDWTTIKIWKIFYENLEGTSNVQKKISDLTIWKVYFINIIIYLYKHITFT